MADLFLLSFFYYESLEVEVEGQERGGFQSHTKANMGSGKRAPAPSRAMSTRIFSFTNSLGNRRVIL